MNKKFKICLTGGPSAGKTTVIDFLKRELADMVHAVPEAASVLYSGGFPRSSDIEHIRSAQRAIYSCQVEMERIFELKEGAQMLLCDRGTMDQTAYWPSGAEDFFTAVGTTPDAEIKRYDYVIHLHTSIFDYEQKFPLRTETLQEALDLDRRILQAWKVHPQRIEIPSRISFHEKMSLVLNAIEKCIKASKASVSRPLESLWRERSL